jgi:GT2 family glycosyltransferase
MQSLVTFVYPIIRTDYIHRSLETLAKHTPSFQYKIVVVDQSMNGIDDPLKKWLFDSGHMYIRLKNVGFSKAANEGIIHALRWNTPYITVCNDDTEFMYDGWFNDAIEEFKTDPQIIAVCPESPRIAMWGYGLVNGEYAELVPYKESFNAEDIEYLKKGDYNKDEIQARHPYQIPATFPFTKRGVVDGIAMWLPIFKREAFIELGLFEEKFIWGGGEDYDMLARAYSCAYPIAREVCDPKYHRRMVSTMKSWVWHWWGQSKDIKETLPKELFDHKEPWNNNNELWGPRFDVWGHYDENGVKKPLKRLQPVHIEEV